MTLDSVTLQQFRSYAKKTFTFSPDTTLIVGVNTAGKTNILEAIYFLATAKSFRARQDGESIRWGSELSAIKGRLSDGSETLNLDLLITHGDVGGRAVPSKKYLVNGVSRRQIDFVGALRAVLFWPEHLELVTDSPSLRRRYLDSVLVQVDREYRRNLLSYERGVRQRNKLLELISEGKASRGQLLFWNQLLIKSGAYLTDARAAFIDFVNEHRMPGVDYHIMYDKSVISEVRLGQYADEEVAAHATLVGPHRDDFLFEATMNKSSVSLSSYGSRGEQRLAVLWLKLAELAFIEQKTGERPILLLDDIFSELDDKHREYVLDLIGKQQTIVTCAEANVIDLIREARDNRVTVISL